MIYPNNGKMLKQVQHDKQKYFLTEEIKILSDKESIIFCNKKFDCGDIYSKLKNLHSLVLRLLLKFTFV